MTRKFSAFLELLEAPNKPDAEVLIQLRMELTSCQGFVECRAFGLSDLHRARHMEHYDMSDWMPRRTIAEILGEEEGSRRTARKSA